MGEVTKPDIPIGRKLQKKDKSQKITISHVANPDGPNRFCVYLYTHLSVCIHVHTYKFFFF